MKRLEWIQSQVEGSYKTDGINSSWIKLPYTTLPGDTIEVKWEFVSLSRQMTILLASSGVVEIRLVEIGEHLLVE